MRPLRKVLVALAVAAAPLAPMGHDRLRAVGAELHRA